MDKNEIMVELVKLRQGLVVLLNTSPLPAVLKRQVLTEAIPALDALDKKETEDAVSAMREEQAQEEAGPTPHIVPYKEN